MSNKDKLIAYWKESSLRDWKRVNLLFKNRDFVFALFCAHMSLEKLFKAHWVKDNEGNYPPKIHNLNKIASQTSLVLTEEEGSFCADMNKFQLEGRYPDYVSDVNRIITRKYAENYLIQCKQLRKKLTDGLR